MWMNFSDYSQEMMSSHRDFQRSRSGSFDRFIPAREMVNFAAASFKTPAAPAEEERTAWSQGAHQDVSREVGETSENNNYADSKYKELQSHGDYRQRMVLLSEGTTEDKILSFRPRQRSGTWSGYRDDATPKPPRRKLPSLPARVLEVNGLNETLLKSSRLFDVNSRGQLAMPVGCEIHVLEFPRGEWKFRSFCFVDQTSREDVHYGRPSVQWSPCGGMLAVSAPHLTLFDAEVGRSTAKVTTFSPPECFDWSKRNISVGFPDGTIHTYDTRCDLNPVGSYTKRGRLSAVTILRYSPDDGLVACGTADGRVVVWDNRRRGSPQHDLDGHADAVGAMAWCRWKPWYLTTGGKASDQTIRIWNAYAGILNKSISTGSKVTSLAWCEQSSELVSSHGSESGEGNIRAWKSPSMHLVGEMRRHQGQVCHVALTVEGNELFSLGSDEILCVWDFFQENTSIPVPQGTLKVRRRASTFTSPGKSAAPVTSPLALGGIR